MVVQLPHSVPDNRVRGTRSEEMDGQVRCSLPWWSAFNDNGPLMGARELNRRGG